MYAFHWMSSPLLNTKTTIRYTYNTHCVRTTSPNLVTFYFCVRNPHVQDHFLVVFSPLHRLRTAYKVNVADHYPQYKKLPLSSVFLCAAKFLCPEGINK